MNVISLQKYKDEKTDEKIGQSPKKNQTWLYSISYDELFSEFIHTFNCFEKDPQCGEIHEWLDMVSDALNERFYNKKTTDQN